MSVLIPILPWYGLKYDIVHDEAIKGWHVWCLRITIWAAHDAVHIILYRGSRRFHPSKL